MSDLTSISPRLLHTVPSEDTSLGSSYQLQGDRRPGGEGSLRPSPAAPGGQLAPCGSPAWTAVSAGVCQPRGTLSLLLSVWNRKFLVLVSFISTFTLLLSYKITIHFSLLYFIYINHSKRELPKL